MAFHAVLFGYTAERDETGEWLGVSSVQKGTESVLMFTSALADIPARMATYGYGLILVMVMLESLGLPLPGEAA